MKDFGTSFYCVSENAMTVPNSDYIWHNPSISIWQTFQCIWVIFTLSLSLKWSISGGFFCCLKSYIHNASDLNPPRSVRSAPWRVRVLKKGFRTMYQAVLLAIYRCPTCAACRIV